MPILYRLMQNKVKSSENYGKYYAHTVRQSEISMEEIEKMVQDSCSAKASDVRLVVRELFEAIKHYMQEGHVVNLGELGKFYISVKSTCVDNPKDFRTDHHLKGFKCNYTPQGHRYKAGSGTLTGRIHRGLLEDCKALETTHYKGKALLANEERDAKEKE